MIQSVDIDDDGEYICRAQNSEGFGQASRPIYVETKGLFVSNFLLNIYQ